MELQWFKRDLSSRNVALQKENPRAIAAELLLAAILCHKLVYGSSLENDEGLVIN